MAYADLASEVAGVIPGISPLLAATHVRRAWRDIRDERNWAFKTALAALVCPPAISAGLVSITQYTNSITFDATATAALASFIAGTPLLTQMQVRFAQGPLYRILAVANNSPLIVTLDRPVTEVSNSLQTYMVYRAYVSPPVADFTKWESFEDYANGQVLTGDRLNRNSVWFDSMDPQRTATGFANYLGMRVADTTGLPVYELWPHPVGGETFVVTFKRTGADFLAPTDVQPTIIPDGLILARALGWYSYIWAQANRGRFPALMKTDFAGLTAATRQQYAFDLNTIRIQDDDSALQSVYNRGHWGGGRRTWPWEQPLGDAKYWQSHAILW